MVVHSDNTYTPFDALSAGLPEKIRKQMKGGGGTDFRPPIELLRKRPPDIAIYLTDLYGPFPDKAPKYPLVWAALSNEKVPWGKVIRLDDFEVFGRKRR